MTPPRFWSNTPEAPGLAAHLLSPLGHIYAAATANRLAKGARKKLSVPIICIGNINAGGTGKTPTVIALVEMAQSLGLTPHIVSRGYRGTLEGPVAVDELAHSAAETGDEPLLLAAFAPTWVAKDRALGAEAAANAGADIILLDDGFQNPALYYDLSIVVVDAAAGFGNGRVIPAGPLREPVETGLSRADYILRIGSKDAIEALDKTWSQLAAKTTLNAELKPLQTGMTWENTPVIAFAGIGHPAKFFDTLRSLGANLIASHALPDHAALPPKLLDRLLREARAHGAQLVTTEKDAARLAPAYRMEVLTLPVRLEWSDPAPLRSAIKALPKR